MRVSAPKFLIPAYAIGQGRLVVPNLRDTRHKPVKGGGDSDTKYNSEPGSVVAPEPRAVVWGDAGESPFLFDGETMTRKGAVG